MIKSFKRSSFLTTISLAGFGALTLGLCLQLPVQAECVRLHTEQAASQALQRAGHRWARVEIHNTAVRLLGQAPDAASRQAALHTARQHLAPAMSWPALFQELQDVTELAAPMARAGLVPPLVPPLVPALVEVAVPCRAQVTQALDGQRILFERGSSELTPQSRHRLLALAEIARHCPAGSLAVQGHTDTTGPAALNQRLSQQRAEAVVAVLAQAGVPAERLQPQGLGASRPLALGNDPAAQALNRRIEFHWAAAAV